MVYPWVVAGWCGVGYGLFLTVTALRSPPGSELTGQFSAQPICKAAMALLLAVRSRSRLIAAGLVCLACAGLLVWFWPHLGALRIPVTAYIVVLATMVCAALLARLPTIWTAVGALCFAVSDAMIGIGRFVLDNEALAVPIWWAYAAAQILITAGFFFGRTHHEPAGSSAASAIPGQ